MDQHRSCRFEPRCCEVFNTAVFHEADRSRLSCCQLRATSPVPMFWSVLVVTLGCAPDADDPPQETEGVVSSPALCPAQFPSEAPTRDDRLHWTSSVCLSLLDPFMSTASASGRLILSSAPASRADPDALHQAFNSPPTDSMSEFAVVLAPFSGTGIQDTLH